MRDDYNDFEPLPVVPLAGRNYATVTPKRPTIDYEKFRGKCSDEEIERAKASSRTPRIGH